MIRRRSLAIVQLSKILANHMYENADEGSFLELTGFNRRSFGVLVNILFPNLV